MPGTPVDQVCPNLPFFENGVMVGRRDPTCMAERCPSERQTVEARNGEPVVVCQDSSSPTPEEDPNALQSKFSLGFRLLTRIGFNLDGGDELTLHGRFAGSERFYLEDANLGFKYHLLRGGNELARTQVSIGIRSPRDPNGDLDLRIGQAYMQTIPRLSLGGGNQLQFFSRIGFSDPWLPTEESNTLRRWHTSRGWGASRGFPKDFGLRLGLAYLTQDRDMSSFESDSRASSGRASAPFELVLGLNNGDKNIQDFDSPPGFLVGMLGRFGDFDLRGMYTHSFPDQDFPAEPRQVFSSAFRYMPVRDGHPGIFQGGLFFVYGTDPRALIDPTNIEESDPLPPIGPDGEPLATPSDDFSPIRTQWYSLAVGFAVNPTDWFTWANRFEYMNDQVENQSLLGITTGANFLIWNRFHLRAEYRFDTSLNDSMPFEGNGNQHVFSIFAAWTDKLSVGP